ncbi:MAG: NADH:ubiquinone oxidoreductase subunit L [Rhodomicrobium sp.]|nr:MAG: NADH:ubiquinone oxidoreductase subunit L [Rhodomicrobium sp.]
MLYQAIILSPLLGALIAGLFGRTMEAKVSEYLTSGLMVLAAILSWVAFINVGFGGETQKIELLPWITSGNLNVSWSLRIDTLTAVMLVVVNTVSTLVHIYSIGYMHHDPHRPRFFAYLSLFTFAMLMLITSDNLLQMFFGWEGVGLASYLLIGFWFKKPSANSAAMKAFIVNRVGDFGFALGIFALFMMTGSINLDEIFAAVPSLVGQQFTFLSWQVDVMTTICLLLFMGAMGKSAQFLLHTWLPDAMEGPTPVSALIHAATMVTAGVFMVARLSPLFEITPDALTVVTGIGAITAFFAATVGLVQNDIKRVIAYSTCSQLGYMFVALGVGAYGAAIFHLFTHAFFKALLFLGAGSVIHAMSDEQDMRNMGGLYKMIPQTYAMMLIGTLALTGFPGFAGFFSKDAIIESAYAAHNPLSQEAFYLLVFAAFLTSFYSWRLIFMTFHGRSRATPDVLSHVHESPKVMLIPLFLLALGAVAAGFAFKEYFFGHHYAEFWGKALFTNASNHIVHEFHNVPLWVKLSPFIAMLLGLGLAYLYYMRMPGLAKSTAKLFEPIYLFLYNKWYFDELYDYIFVRPAKWLARQLWQVGDRAIIDGLVNGIANRSLDVTGKLKAMQTGYVYHYAFVMMIGLTAIITYFVVTGGAGQ